MKKKRRVRETSRHHIVPRSMGGVFTKRIRNTEHRAIHTLFSNQIITEKIWHLIEMDWEVLTDEFKARVYSVINDPQRAYKRSAFKNFESFRRLQNRFDNENN